jgi:two-component system chemotaxis sensor kinase CheA
MSKTTTSPEAVRSAPVASRTFSFIIYGLLALIIAAGSFGIHKYTQDLAHATDVNNKRINLAGRQRALSQRMTKALLAYDLDTRAQRPADAPLGELRKVSGIFNAVIRGFDAGGTVPGTDGKEFLMPAVSDSEEKRIVRDALELWLPLYDRLQGVASGKASAEQLTAAVEMARARNVPIFDLMNELTNRTEVTARASINGASLPRNVLIALVSIAAFLIPGFFLWSRAREQGARARAAFGSLESTYTQLSSQSAALATAKAETDRIMETVQEGLLLIDSNGIIGEYHSRELLSIFRQEQLAGLSLLNLLQRLLSEKMFNTTKDYIGLLFDANRKEKTILKVNPLTDIEVNFSNPAGGFIHRYLGFSFRRIMDGDRVARIFVAVRDVTPQVELEKKLREAEKNKDRQLDILLGIVHVPPAELENFAQLVEVELDTINRTLRAEDFAAATTGGHTEALRDRLKAVFRSVHNIKGNAALLRLAYFQKSADAFETKLAELLDRPVLNGDDFLAVVVAQASLRADLGDLQDLRVKLGTHRSPVAVAAGPAGSAGSALATQLRQLVADASRDLDKSTQVTIDDFAVHTVAGPRTDLVRDVLVQLARNSLAHSVETPAMRVAIGKPATATLSIRGLPPTADGLVGLAVRDDGRGLDLAAIRTRAEATGLIPQGSEPEPAELVRCIFAPGFSTAAQVGAHAGRGMGMDIIKTKVVDEAGGAIEVHSTPGEFCEFHVYLPAATVA